LPQDQLESEDAANQSEKVHLGETEKFHSSQRVRFTPDLIEKPFDLLSEEEK
jgi:hypothetical protein